MTRPLPAAAFAAALALVLTSCGEPADTQQSSSPTESPTVAEVRGIERDVTFAGAELSVEVGPVVIDGEHALLRIVPENVSGTEVSLLDLFAPLTNTSDGGTGEPMRLVDVDRSLVYDALGTSNEPGLTLPPGESRTWYAQFDTGELAAGGSIDAMIQGVGYVEDIAVVEAGEPGAFDVAEAAVTESADYSAPLVAPMTVYSELLDKSLDTAVGEEGLEINLASDVFFAVDSADLTPEASQRLTDVVAALEPYSGGSMTIVGHTDDVADDAYNQGLSERRAESVRVALAGLTDLSRFTVGVEGRGETDPRVDATSDEARQANRRVEIEIVPEGETSRDVVAGGGTFDPSGFTGAVAAGPDGVDVTYPDGKVVNYQMEEVRRRGGYLIGDLAMTAVTGDVLAPGSLLGGGRMLGLFIPYGDAPTDLSLALADERVSPVHYSMPARADFSGEPRQWALVDKMLSNSLDEGESLTTTLVWPDTGQDEVTAYYAPDRWMQSNAPVLLTDIPVVEDPVQ